ncbi:MAG: S49 family peptidase [Sphingomonadales bacterium]
MKHFIYSMINKFRPNPPAVVAVIKMTGVIAVGGRLGQTINLEGYEKIIETAFSMPGLKAVALSINSPGGSPVQSGLILNRIRQLADKGDIPVLAFVEDVAASGGYMLAIAGDEIFAHDASIIGSIGVIYAGFGYTEAMKKLGVERRLHTAGESKSMLDPFSPEKAEDIRRLKDLQTEIHDYFKSVVKDRRGKKLKDNHAKLFSGDVWVGKGAQKMGLIDGVGELKEILRKKFGENVKIRDLSQKKPRLSSILGILKGADANLGAPYVKGWADELFNTIETRSFWSRWGL